MISTYPGPNVPASRNDDCGICGTFMFAAARWIAPGGIHSQPVCKPCYDGTRIKAHQATYAFECNVAVECDACAGPVDGGQQRWTGERLCNACYFETRVGAHQGTYTLEPFDVAEEKTSC